MSESSLLSPAFEDAFWRSLQRIRFREHPGFSKKKGHYEPEERNSFAARWAAELTLQDSQEEIRQVYENCVTILKNKRSAMERSDRELETAQFRYTVEAAQDPEDPEYILITRSLWIKAQLNELPAQFDQIFSHPPDELLVPVSAHTDRKEILVLLEQWETLLQGRLEESVDGSTFRLWLKSGFSMSVNLATQEVVFAKSSVAGALHLASAVAKDLKSLGITKQLS